MTSGGAGPCREFGRGPRCGAAEGRDLSSTSGVPADIGYRV